MSSEVKKPDTPWRTDMKKFFERPGSDKVNSHGLVDPDFDDFDGTMEYVETALRERGTL